MSGLTSVCLPLGLMSVFVSTLLVLDGKAGRKYFTHSSLVKTLEERESLVTQEICSSIEMKGQ